ncbi:hypothetical protein AV650_21950 [Serratia fonticola]|nr:hypothetical protein AV650_21950 [Serratia fonticola]
MSKVENIISKLVCNNLINQHSLIGCSTHEVEELESFLGYTLPFEYKEFLRILGKGAGSLFQGTDIYYPRVLELKSEAEELISEMNLNKHLPDNAFVFCMHQGYECNYFLIGEPDPTIFQFYEGQENQRIDNKAYDSFSQFIAENIKSHLSIRHDLN